jgi:hypothetical protein
VLTVDLEPVLGFGKNLPSILVQLFFKVGLVFFEKFLSLRIARLANLLPRVLVSYLEFRVPGV